MGAFSGEIADLDRKRNVYREGTGNAVKAPAGLTAEGLHYLQRVAGNQAVNRLLQPCGTPSLVPTAGRSTVVQRCGATPCNCTEEERAAHESTGAVQRQVIQRWWIQRDDDDDDAQKKQSDGGLLGTLASALPLGALADAVPAPAIDPVPLSGPPASGVFPAGTGAGAGGGAAAGEGAAAGAAAGEGTAASGAALAGGATETGLIAGAVASVGLGPVLAVLAGGAIAGAAIPALVGFALDHAPEVDQKDQQADTDNPDTTDHGVGGAPPQTLPGTDGDAGAPAPAIDTGQPSGQPATTPATPGTQPTPDQQPRRFPNQTCTNEELDQLQAQKDAVCGNIPGESCSDSKVSPKRLARRPCSQIRARIQAMEQCLQLRKNIQDKCFGGNPDPAHQNAIQEIQNGIDACRALEAVNCAPGHPMANQ